MPRVSTAPLPAYRPARWWRLLLLLLGPPGIGSLLGWLSLRHPELWPWALFGVVGCAVAARLYSDACRIDDLSKRVLELEHRARIVHLLVTPNGGDN